MVSRPAITLLFLENPCDKIIYVRLSEPTGRNMEYSNGSPLFATIELVSLYPRTDLVLNSLRIKYVTVINRKPGILMEET